MGAPVVQEADPTTLERVVDTFRSGGVFVYPTATVYGIGGDPRNPATSDRIHRIKGSPEKKPHLVLTDDWDRVDDWITAVSWIHERLMQIGRNHAITILFAAAAGAPPHLVGDSGHVAIRLTSHPFCSSLVAALGSVVISTSANRTGKPEPASFTDIDPAVIAEVDLAVDGGRSAGAASTIVAVNNDVVQVVREGSVSKEKIISELDNP